MSEESTPTTPTAVRYDCAAPALPSPPAYRGGACDVYLPFSDDEATATPPSNRQTSRLLRSLSTSNPTVSHSRGCRGAVDRSTAARGDPSPPHTGLRPAPSVTSTGVLASTNSQHSSEPPLAAARTRERCHSSSSSFGGVAAAPSPCQQQQLSDGALKPQSSQPIARPSIRLAHPIAAELSPGSNPAPLHTAGVPPTSEHHHTEEERSTVGSAASSYLPGRRPATEQTQPTQQTVTPEACASFHSTHCSSGSCGDEDEEEEGWVTTKLDAGPLPPRKGHAAMDDDGGGGRDGTIDLCRTGAFPATRTPLSAVAGATPQGAAPDTTAQGSSPLMPHAFTADGTTSNPAGWSATGTWMVQGFSHLPSLGQPASAAVVGSTLTECRNPSHSHDAMPQQEPDACTRLNHPLLLPTRPPSPPGALRYEVSSPITDLPLERRSHHTTAVRADTASPALHQSFRNASFLAKDALAASMQIQPNQQALVAELERRRRKLRKQLVHLQSEAAAHNIFALVRASNASQVQYLLQERLGNVNERDYNGCTPLHVAAGEGNQTMVRVLLSFGADVLAVDNAGRTPLDCAAANRHSGVGRHLLAVIRCQMLRPEDATVATAAGVGGEALAGWGGAVATSSYSSGPLSNRSPAFGRGGQPLLASECSPPSSHAAALEPLANLPPSHHTPPHLLRRLSAYAIPNNTSESTLSTPMWGGANSPPVVTAPSYLVRGADDDTPSGSIRDASAPVHFPPQQHPLVSSATDSAGEPRQRQRCTAAGVTGTSTGSSSGHRVGQVDSMLTPFGRAPVPVSAAASHAGSSSFADIGVQTLEDHNRHVTTMTRAHILKPWCSACGQAHAPMAACPAALPGPNPRGARASASNLPPAVATDPQSSGGAAPPPHSPHLFAPLTFTSTPDNNTFVFAPAQRAAEEDGFLQLVPSVATKGTDLSYSRFSTISDTVSLVVCMCGLPGRGKSFISRRIVRYMNWKGVPCKVFNAGDYRRHLLGVEGTAGADFFNPDNPNGKEMRERMADLACEDLMRFLSLHPLAVAILDATNTTKARRLRLKRFFENEGKRLSLPFRLLFIESVCTDDTIITENILRSKCGNDDFKNVQDTSSVIAEFRNRILQYERVYETLDPSEELPFIKIINVKHHVLLHKVPTGLGSRVAFFLLNLHPVAYPIYIALSGETEGNCQGLYGGDERLTANGKAFAVALKRFIQDRYVPHMIVLHGTNHSVLSTLRPLVENDDVPGQSAVGWGGGAEAAPSHLHAARMDPVTVVHVAAGPKGHTHHSGGGTPPPTAAHAHPTRLPRGSRRSPRPTHCVVSPTSALEQPIRPVHAPKTVEDLRRMAGGDISGIPKRHHGAGLDTVPEASKAPASDPVKIPPGSEPLLSSDDDEDTHTREEEDDDVTEEVLCPVPGLDDINYGRFSGHTPHWVREKYPRLSKIFFVEPAAAPHAVGTPSRTGRSPGRTPSLPPPTHYPSIREAMRYLQPPPTSRSPQLAYSVQFPNGESCRQVNVRLEPALMAVMRTQSPVFVVTSQVPAEGLVAFFSDLMPEMSPTLHVPQHCVVEFGLRGDVTVHPLLPDCGPDVQSPVLDKDEIEETLRMASSMRMTTSMRLLPDSKAPWMQ